MKVAATLNNNNNTSNCSYSVVNSPSLRIDNEIK